MVSCEVDLLFPTQTSRLRAADVAVVVDAHVVQAVVVVDAAVAAVDAAAAVVDVVVAATKFKRPK
jgi:hypothetical protein